MLWTCIHTIPVIFLPLYEPSWYLPYHPGDKHTRIHPSLSISRINFVTKLSLTCSSLIYTCHYYILQLNTSCYVPIIIISKYIPHFCPPRWIRSWHSWGTGGWCWGISCSWSTSFQIVVANWSCSACHLVHTGNAVGSTSLQIFWPLLSIHLDSLVTWGLCLDTQLWWPHMLPWRPCPWCWSQISMYCASLRSQC